MLHSILKRYHAFGWSTPEGEWGYIHDRQRVALHQALASGRVGVLQPVLDGMFRNDLSFGLASYPKDMDRDFALQVTWRIALWCQHTKDRSPARLDAPRACNPVVLPMEQYHVMIDTPRFDCYAERMADILPDGATVLEIGCGYGGVALQLRRMRSDVRIILCDLPETLYLAGYWLSHEQEVAWWDASTDAPITLLPSQALEESPPVDLVFSAHSLSGMGREAVARYMAWLGHSGARFFYHDDVFEPVVGPWLTAAFPEIPSRDIVPPGFTEQWRLCRPWGGLGDRFCEFFYERTA